jgi:hypothetical protein
MRSLERQVIGIFAAIGLLILLAMSLLFGPSYKQKKAAGCCSADSCAKGHHHE